MKPSSKPTPSLPPALVTRIEMALKALYPDALEITVRVDKTNGVGSRAKPLEVIIRARVPTTLSRAGWITQVAGGSLNRWIFVSIDEAVAGVEERFAYWLQRAIDQHTRDAAAKREEARERTRQAEREDIRARDVREALMAFVAAGAGVPHPTNAG